MYIVIQPTLLISVSLLRFATLITSGLALSVIADFSRHLLAEYCWSEWTQQIVMDHYFRLRP